MPADLVVLAPLRRDGLEDYIENRRKNVKDEIDAQIDSYILNVSVDEYAKHLADQFQIEVPTLYWSDLSVDDSEENVRGSRFPSDDFMGLSPSKTYKMQVIHFHVPYSGDVSLLQYYPNPRQLIQPEVEVVRRENSLKISIVNFNRDVAQVQSQFQVIKNEIYPNYESVRTTCETFNRTLRSTVEWMINGRREKVLSKNNFLTSLGVPIRQKHGTAETFSVPSPRLKETIRIRKPTVMDKDFHPEPALDDNNYKKILKIISDVGHNLERMPSTYKGKVEEDIRDHILLVLDPNFELGSATGETFNRVGKTDICLRYDSGVVFIAECKYWKGEKAFLKTIDQLLGYLTWRNSKVAVINFVQNIEFSDVLKKVTTITQTHPNYVGDNGRLSESRFSYKFHLNGDQNRIIDLAVISFHLPK